MKSKTGQVLSLEFKKKEKKAIFLTNLTLISNKLYVYKYG